MVGSSTNSPHSGARFRAFCCAPAILASLVCLCSVAEISIARESSQTNRLAPVLRLKHDEGDHNGGMCKLSPSSKRASNSINDDDGTLIRAESYVLSDTRTNGYAVTMSRKERVNGTYQTQTYTVFFPFGATTRTQVFGGVRITGTFK